MIKGDSVIGHFESEARKAIVDNHPYVAVWSDGVMLMADNGNSPILQGRNSPRDFDLKPGAKYRITVELIGDENE